MSTVPTLEEVLDLLPKTAENTFLPSRYPYTYAYDFLREHHSLVVPEAVVEKVRETKPNHVTFDNRAMVAGFVTEWARIDPTADKDSICKVFADAYLVENHITKTK